MQTREKAGIVIFIILVIIWGIIFWNGEVKTNPKATINCKTACHKIGNMGWIFPGAGPVMKNKFPTEDDCISACQARAKR